MSKEKEYHFALILSGVTEHTEGLEDDLFEAGCDDALVFFKNNTVYLEFDRESESLDQAIISAVKSVEGLSSEIKVKRVEPDTIVNLSDIARRSGLTKQSISMLVSGERGDGTFPSPISKVISSTPLWKWSTVADWLLAHEKLDSQSVQSAHLIEDINGALELRDSASIKRRKQWLKKIETSSVA